MAADGSIVIDTKLDQSGLKKDLTSLKTTLGKGVKVAAKSAAVAIAGITAAIAGIAKGAKEFSALTDRVDKLSQRLGLSREGFQEWEYVLSQAGVSIDGLQMGMKTLAQRMEESNDAATIGAERFDALNVSVMDAEGNFRSQEAVFNDTIMALADMEDGIEKAAIAQDLFGRNGQELLPLLNSTSESMADLKQEARDLGLVMSDDVVDAGVILTDSMDRLKRVGKGLFVEIFSGIVPTLNDLLAAFSDFVKGAGGVQGIVSSIGDYFRDMGLDIKIAWITLIDAISRYAFRWVQGFRVDIANMEIAWTSATQGMKIGIYTVSAAIYDKLLPAVADMINFFSWVPFIGDDFAVAASKVDEFNMELQAGYEEDIQAGREMIQQSKDNRDAIVDEIDGEVAARKEATAQKIDDLRELSDAEKEARAEERTAEREREAAEAKEAQAKKDQIAQLQALASLESSFRDEQAKNQQKYELGLLTEEELIGANISAMESYINSLIDMGVTADSAASEGGAALQNMLELLTSEKAKINAEDGGGEIGVTFAEGIGTGIIETASSILSTTKTIISSVAGVASSVASSISGAISWAAAFDVDELWETFEELIDGIENFFMVDLGALPVYFEAGAEMIQELVSGITDNWDSITETIDNLFMTIASTISENLPAVLSLGVEILDTMLTGILNALSDVSGIMSDLIDALIDAAVTAIPMLISIGGEMLKAIMEGIEQNTDALVDGLVDTIVFAIDYVAENLDDFVGLGVDIIVGLLTGINKSIPQLVKAIIAAMPDIIVAFMMLQIELVKAAPEIILALLEGLVTAILEMPGALISAIIEVFTDFIDAIKDFFGIHSPSTVFAGFGQNMIQGLINGILNFGDSLWSGVKSVFTGLWDGIVNVFTGAFDLGSDIINGIISGINSAVSGVGNFFSGIGSGISDFFGGFFANGTNFAPGGLSIVGERGPELVNLPKGSQVYTNSETEQLLSAGSSVSSSVGAVAMGGMPITVYVNGTMEVDGRAIGEISYEYMDEVAAGA